MSARDDAIARLHGHWSRISDTSLRDLFHRDSQRFDSHSAKLGDLLLDYSKCRLDQPVLHELEVLMTAAGVASRRDAMFEGLPVNETENRPALHVALRNRSGRFILVDGIDVMPEVAATLHRLETFAEGVRTAAIAGKSGRPFTDVVNIGIGGSDLGPAMVTLALAPYHDGPRVHFVSNVDGAHIGDTLGKLQAETTLFLIASKTFATIETMTNAHTARQWLADRVGPDAVGRQFVALSTAMEKVKAFGIEADQTFGFWDWVGGRYSVWSAIGLPVMIAIGARRFREFLDGGHRLDENFRLAPFRQNLAMLLGGIGFWHRAICGYPVRAVLPYDQRLARLPAHLQQLDMESNGKSVAIDGAVLAGPSGPVVFGEPGTNGQHAFFQLLHQGTDVVPCEFLIAGEGHEAGLEEHQRLLIANCLAQSEALAVGKTREEAEAELKPQGLGPAEVARLTPHKVFPGNRPSLTMAYAKLDPATLGTLIALYEHRVFVEAVLYQVNPFDQWGVELGKSLAARIERSLDAPDADPALNGSTRGLIKHLFRR